MPFFNMDGNGTGSGSGLVVLSGSGAPSDTLGVAGQAYIDTTNEVFYGPKGSTGWGDGIPFAGTVGNHTHSIADVTNLTLELAGKANAVHTHSIADVTNLQVELDGLTDQITQLSGNSSADGHTHVKQNITDLATTDLDLGGNRCLFGNVYNTTADFPDAATYHGGFAHSHADGAAYFAHNGAWVELAKSSDIGTGGGGVSWVTPPPATSDSTGTAGDLSYDSTYLYVCTSDNNWGRVDLEYWGIVADRILSESGDPILAEDGNYILHDGTVPPATITITSQPQDASGTGGTATFSVSATHSDSGTLSYQWQVSTDSGANWANVSNETSATVSVDINETNDGNSYRVIVSGPNAASVTSNAALLAYVAEIYATGWLDYNYVGDPLNTSLAGDYGYDIDASSDGTVVVVAIRSQIPASGIVRVYKRNASTGVYDQRGADITNLPSSICSCVAISADGSRIAIGSSTSGSYLYVMDWDGTAWSVVGSPFPNLASSVDLSGDGLTVATSGGGSTVCYSWNGSWYSLSPVNTSGSDAVAALSYNGSYMVIGNRSSDSSAGRWSVWNYASSQWNLVGNEITGAAAGDELGSSVDITDDGSLVIIGEQGHDSNKGRVRVYQLSGLTWTQYGSELLGTVADQQLGHRVSITSSSDTNDLAISASGPSEYRSATASNGGFYAWDWATVEVQENVFALDWVQRSGCPIVQENTYDAGSPTSHQMLDSLLSKDGDVGIVSNSGYSVHAWEWVGAITFGTQPADQPISSTGTATFTAAATAAEGQTVSYQWQLSTDSGATWSDIAGETSATLSLSGLASSDDGKQYRVIASVGDRATASSNAATLQYPGVTVASGYELDPADATRSVGQLWSDTVYFQPSSGYYVYQVDLERDRAAVSGEEWSLVEAKTAYNLSVGSYPRADWVIDPGAGVGPAYSVVNYTPQESSENGDRYRMKAYAFRSDLISGAFYEDNALLEMGTTATPEGVWPFSAGKFNLRAYGYTSRKYKYTFSFPRSATIFVEKGDNYNGEGALSVKVNGVEAESLDGISGDQVSVSVSAYDTVTLEETASGGCDWIFWEQSEPESASISTVYTRAATLTVT